MVAEAEKLELAAARLAAYAAALGHDMTYEQYTTIVEKVFMLLTMFNCCVLNKRR